MKLISALLKKPSCQYGIFFLAGVSLEVFMNFFHIGEANIYRSILKNLSETRAQQRFELEKSVFDSINREEEE